MLINFAYNINELAKAYKNRQELTIKLNKTKLERTSKENITTELDSANQSLINCDVSELMEKIQGLDNLI